MHRLAHQGQVCIEGAGTCAHAVDIGGSARELYRQVGHSIVEYVDVHLALNRTLLSLGVTEGWLNANSPHGDLSISLTRKWYLNHTIEMDKES